MAKVTRTLGPAYGPLAQAVTTLNQVQGKVGWFESARYPGGIPVALIAAVNEFGWPEHNIPPRLGMRATAEAMRDKWAQIAATVSKRVLTGSMTAWQAMEVLGASAAGDIRKHIASVTQPPLKVATVEARLRGVKQGNVVAISIAKPLVRTGRLINTLTNATVAK